MEKEEVVRRIGEAGAIAILRVDSPERCVRVVDALVEGGIRAVEVTTSTPGATDIISAARRKHGDGVIVGIGTVLDRATAEKGVLAGAQFVVSPSLHKDVLDVCRERGVAGCPGTFTATEMVQAWRWGADLIKVFPASTAGPDYVRAILSPLPWLKLVPTGGVNAGNAAGFIRAGAFCVGVGGALTASREISAVSSAARELVAAVNGARSGSD